MGGTTKGGVLAAKVNKERHGERFYAEIGALGGRAKNPNKGFGSDRKRASEAGRRGGLKSKKTKATV